MPPANKETPPFGGVFLLWSGKDKGKGENSDPRSFTVIPAQAGTSMIYRGAKQIKLNLALCKHLEVPACAGMTVPTAGMTVPTAGMTSFGYSEALGGLRRDDGANSRDGCVNFSTVRTTGS